MVAVGEQCMSVNSLLPRATSISIGYQDSVPYHSHQLRISSTRNSKLVDHRRQHEGDSPASDTVGNPDHEKRYESRILEQSLDL